MAKTSIKDSGTPGIALDDAVSELFLFIEDANDFRASELEEGWALAERYYNGYTDLEDFEGRSVVVKTEVRDAIRNTMPSIMRTLMHSRKPMTYMPSSPQHAAWVEQQAAFCADLFYKNDGYNVLYNSVLEALKLKIGPMKAFWEPDPLPEYFRYTGVQFSVVEELTDNPLMDVLDFEEEETQLGNTTLYTVSGYKIHENGKIVIESVPNYEFFITGECNSIEMAIRQGVHGQSSIVTVSEAQDMGLEADDWMEFDAEDPELSDHGESSQERRGYVKDDPNDLESNDVTRRKFLLTECYVSYDLNGTGRPQLYRFWLGGTSYKYIDHEEVDDSPFSLAVPIPQSHTVYGHSLADLTINEQDASTSLMRAMIDNAHASNDAKIAADPSKTNFDDLMNKAINAPVRKRAGDTLQVIQVPFTGQGTLGILQYLDQDVQNKTGITKAAQGLDPDAMQSTDKQAVMNTIMTSQGQTELMVRNIIETGLIRLFRRLLKLSIQHQAPIQMMQTKGVAIAVDTRMFDPDATAVPNVGLGTGSPQQKQAALSMVLERQEMYMEKFGPNNPFTSYTQMYNTLEDLVETNGVYEISRYFKVVTPEIEKRWAAEQEKKQAEQMKLAQENKPLDPSKAYMEIETAKREIDNQRLIAESYDKERQRALTALTSAEQNDIQRDKLVQEKVIKLSELGIKGADAKIKAEQLANNAKQTQLGEGDKPQLPSPKKAEKIEVPMPPAPDEEIPSGGAGRMGR